MSQDAHCVLKSKIDALCGWWCRSYSCLTVNRKFSLFFSCVFLPIGLFPIFHTKRFPWVWLGVFHLVDFSLTENVLRKIVAAWWWLYPGWFVIHPSRIPCLICTFSLLEWIVLFETCYESSLHLSRVFLECCLIVRLEFLCRYVLCRKSQVSYPLISIPIFQLQSLLVSIVYSHSLFFFVSGVFWRDDIGNRWIFVIDEVSVIPVWPRIYFFLYASTWPSFNFVCFPFFLFFTWPVLVWSLLGYFEL